MFIVLFFGGLFVIFLVGCVLGTLDDRGANRARLGGVSGNASRAAPLPAVPSAAGSNRER
jgi:hypothetical protein